MVFRSSSFRDVFISSTIYGKQSPIFSFEDRERVLQQHPNSVFFRFESTDKIDAQHKPKPAPEYKPDLKFTNNKQTHKITFNRVPENILILSHSATQVQPNKQIDIGQTKTTT